MPYKMLAPEPYNDFIEKLSAEPELSLALPFWKEGKTVFETTGAAYPELGPRVGAEGYFPTLLPPKKYLLPPRERLLKFDKDRAAPEPMYKTPLIIAGVRPCDINAIRQTDKVYLEDITDPYYQKKRDRALVLGWDCLSHCDEWCFCESVGGLAAKSGFDLLFTPLRGKYEDCIIVSLGSQKGTDLLARYGAAGNVPDEIMSAFQQQQAQKLAAFPKRLKENIQAVPLLLTGSYESPQWEELGDLCLGCGACVLVCPTCTCFDVKDKINLDFETGARERSWDGCMLPAFARVVGGHNFRPGRKERIRHRIYRKFKYQMQRYNEPYCTGCGRCIRSCLVDISPFDVINRLFELNLERRHSRSPSC